MTATTPKGGPSGPLFQSPRLWIVPVTLKEANAFVRQHHRHHDPVPGAKFCLAVAKEQAVTGELARNDPFTICGVAIVGRPVACLLDDGWTLEVNRTCTDGTKNANSALYGACRRATFALGYRKLITYTLPSESGVSLSAAAWKCVGEAGGQTWNRRKRPRVDIYPLQRKLKWEVTDDGPAWPLAMRDADEDAERFLEAQ